MSQSAVVLGPVQGDTFKTGHVYQTEPFRPPLQAPDAPQVSLRFGVFGDEQSGFRVERQVIGPGGEATPVETTPSVGLVRARSIFWGTLDRLPDWTEVYELVVVPESKPEVRATAEAPDVAPATERLPEDHLHPPESPRQTARTDGPRAAGSGPQGDARPAREHGEDPFGGPPRADDRAERTAPETEAGAGGLEAAARAAEDATSRFFENGQRATDDLTRQLDEYVLDGGNWVAGALAGTGLGVLNAAMEFSRGFGMAVIDSRRLGEGVAKGTWAGVKEDAGRLTMLLPQGRATMALSTGLMISDVVDAARDPSTASVGSAAFNAGMALASRGKVARGGRRRSGSHELQQRDFAREYMSRRTLTAREIGALRRRVKRLQNLLEQVGRNRSTTAIVVAEDPRTGQLIKLVSSSRGRLPRRIREKLSRDEYECPGNRKSRNASPKDHAHHAEMNALQTVVSSGYKVVAIVPSRNACALCAEARVNLGVPIIDP